MNKCMGCGAVFQMQYPNQEGYVKEQNQELCERCFKIRHYGDYQMIAKNNDEFETILKAIGTTNDLVVFVIDVFMIPPHITSLITYFKQNILFVFTKRDVLPKSINDQKFIRYLEILGVYYTDCVVVSSYKNHGFDLLMEKISKYQTSNRVYVVGYTNAGKSTLINTFIRHYSNMEGTITTSILPSTTLNMIEIPLNDQLTLIDTPGLLDIGSWMHFADMKLLKKICPKKEIKPITYQVKEKQTFFIDDLVRIDVNNRNNFTFYFSNLLTIRRVFKETTKMKDFQERMIRVNQGEDIVISGLGFIRVSHKDAIWIYTKEAVDIYTRKNLI